MSEPTLRETLVNTDRHETWRTIAMWTLTIIVGLTQWIWYTHVNEFVVFKENTDKFRELVLARDRELLTSMISLKEQIKAQQDFIMIHVKANEKLETRIEKLDDCCRSRK